MDQTSRLYQESPKSYGMQDSNPANTPADANSKLQPTTNQHEPLNQTQYQSAIGSLMYLSVNSRPDIAFAVNNLARFNSNARKEDLTALKQVLWYD